MVTALVPGLGWALRLVHSASFATDSYARVLRSTWQLMVAALKGLGELPFLEDGLHASVGDTPLNIYFVDAWSGPSSRQSVLFLLRFVSFRLLFFPHFKTYFRL
uniref:(northern house mosquito) hypothetical protein n=1 Tax=Culex pipiens TaxID=7175 RepID=A0A8D8GRT4_CULPI